MKELILQEYIDKYAKFHHHLVNEKHTIAHGLIKHEYDYFTSHDINYDDYVDLLKIAQVNKPFVQVYGRSEKIDFANRPVYVEEHQIALTPKIYKDRYDDFFVISHLKDGRYHLNVATYYNTGIDPYHRGGFEVGRYIFPETAHLSVPAVQKVYKKENLPLLNFMLMVAKNGMYFSYKQDIFDNIEELLGKSITT